MDWTLRELASSTETLSAFLTPELSRIGDPDIVVRLVLQVLLLIGSACFSGSETALFSLSRLDLQKESHTIGGLVMNRLRRIPVRGESVVEAGYLFTVEEASDRTVLKLRVEPVGAGTTTATGGDRRGS